MCVFITDKSSSVDEKGRYSDTQTTTERPKTTVERLVFDSETGKLIFFKNRVQIQHSATL